MHVASSMMEAAPIAAAGVNLRRSIASQTGFALRRTVPDFKVRKSIANQTGFARRHAMQVATTPLSAMDMAATAAADFNLEKSIAEQTLFGLRLAKHLASSQAADSNLALSPISVHAILSLIAAGSKGRTLDQFLYVLRASGADELQSLSSQIVALVLADGAASGGPRLSFPNGGWLDASLSLKPSFKEIASSTYKAEVKAVDFQTKAEEARREVNSWVENATAGFINEILPPRSVDFQTKLVFANALHFKGAWDQKFDASKTKESEFHLLNGTSARVPYMTTQEDQHLAAYDGFKVLELPYRQGVDEQRGFSMCIFLPDAKDGLWSLSDKLCSEPGFLDRHLPRSIARVGKFKLPRFKVSFRLEASRVLKDMGLVLPFSPYEADLTAIAGCRLSVSAVFHESFVEVDEEGTEAAAATAAVLNFGGMVAPPKELPPKLDFEADHPFVFLIREQMTGAVMFVGHVLNPLE